MTEIVYWLVRKSSLAETFGFIRPLPRYAKFGFDGEIETTEDPKKALRWLTAEGATQFADRLGWEWMVCKVTFPGDQLVG